MIVITERAKEQSTFVFTVSFADEEGDAVVPNEINWTLTDKDGTVINAREEVEILTPAAEIDIVLSGDDLQILSAEVGRGMVKRRLIIRAEYDSTLGDDLPVKNVAAFTIQNFPHVETIVAV